MVSFNAEGAKLLLRPVSARPDAGNVSTMEKLATPSAVNPFLPPAEIDAARIELPEMVFRQEYLAEFLSGDGAVFRNVDNCLTAVPSMPIAHRDHVIVAGVDWARLHDFTAISVVCCDCQCEVALDRFNQIGWAFQRERLCR